MVCPGCRGSGLRADELGLADDDEARQMLDSTRCYTCAGDGVVRADGSVDEE